MGRVDTVETQMLGIKFRLCHLLVMGATAQCFLHQAADSSTKWVGHCSLLGIAVKEKGEII